MPVFRAEKHNTLAHLNEVLQMDIEMGFADHNDAMDVLETVFLNILSHVKNSCGKELETLGANIAVPEKVPRYTYTELIDALSKSGHPIKWGDDFDREAEAKVCEIMKTEAYFITEWPTEQKAFYAMPKEGEEKLCNAYDLIYRGMEISSGSQRVHSPELLIKQLKARNLNPADFEFYINAFRVGAPPHAGWSIGLERIAMKMAGLQNIRECALFPRDRMRLTP
jgi:nondiscriminating aspartyl-tRNA synthetase